MRQFNGVAEGAKKVIEFAMANGWSVSKSKKMHYRFERPGYRSVFFSSTPSDHRAQLNGISKLRNSMRTLNDRSV
jgi:hypothetical protein